MRKYPEIFLFAVAVLAINTFAAEAADAINDGFIAAKTLKSRYFDIEAESGVNITGLTVSLAVPPSITAIIREPITPFSELTLQNQLDLLYLSVSEIMDMKPAKFRCIVKICKDRASLSRIASNLYGQEIQPGGFYAAAFNCLYVDADNVSINILGHELGHALQAHYFVVPPSVRIQEVLSGYVEFQLRKYSNTLPK